VTSLTFRLVSILDFLMSEPTDEAMRSVLLTPGGLARMHLKGPTRKKSPPKAKPAPSVPVEAPTAPTTTVSHRKVVPVARPTVTPELIAANLAEVLTVPARPASVPVRVIAEDAGELPQWQDLAGLDGPSTSERAVPSHVAQSFVAGDDAVLLSDWFAAHDRPHLQAVALAATQHDARLALLALPAEWAQGQCRRHAVLARVVPGAEGTVKGYEYPTAACDQLAAWLPWPQYLPLDERNEVVRRLEALAGRARRARVWG
jgi:hypothetical protein